MQRDKDLLDFMYRRKFYLDNKIKELESINVFNGDDNNKCYELIKLEIRLNKDDVEIIDNIIDMYIGN